MANRPREQHLLQDLLQAAKGLAHPTRLRLLGMLSSGELCVCQMTAVPELAPSTLSQHLSVLSRGRLVVDRKEGKRVFDRLGQEGAAAALLPQILDLLAADTQVQTDLAVVEVLRRVSVAALCAADLDLVGCGVLRPAGTAVAARQARGGLR